MCPQACPDLVRFITERAAFWAVLLICTSRESFRGSLLEQLLRQRPRPILGGVFLLGRFGLVSRLADHEPVPVAFCHGSDPPSTGTRAATADLIDCAEEAGWLPDHDANERCRCEDECSYRQVNVQSGFAICHQMIHWKAPPSRRRLEPCVPRQGWLRRRLGLHSAVLESGHAAVLELGCRQVNRHPRDQERGATNHHSEKSNAELRGHIGTSARPKTRPVNVGPQG